MSPSALRSWPSLAPDVTGLGMDTLIDRYGLGFGVPALLRLLSADCPKRRSLSASDLCGVHCPELSALFMR
jgi:hypothetical protein